MSSGDKHRPPTTMVDDDAHELATELDALADASTAELTADHVYLVLKMGEGRKVIEVPERGELVFGRGEDCQVVLDQPKVSRAHFKVKRRGPLVWVEDLDSTNGTKLNGVTVRAAERRLVGGDVIHVGQTEITVAAASGSGALGGAVTSRLELELGRLQETASEATLLRIELPPHAARTSIEEMATALNAVALVEERGEGEYAALVATTDNARIGTLVTAIRSAVPGAEIMQARYPVDGATLRELWRTSDRQADDAPGELAQNVCVADPAMMKVFRIAERVATTDATVLVLGETGSGKEVLAEQIHRSSARAEHPYVRLNCASLPETLLSSELFGHERGAFTGADRRKIGYFEAANGGTLLLDEIGELSLSMQVKLLRVLENRTVLRLGATNEIPVNVRVICATHKDLKHAVAEGSFREDLFYRVSAFTLTVPPLRDRPTEIGLLTELFLRQLGERMGRPPPAISDAVLAILTSHRWPGNVRELRNAIEHAFVMCDGDTIVVDHLPETMRMPDTPHDQQELASGGVRDKLEQIERASIVKALADENGNQTKAAKRLGMSRRALIYKMGKYAIRRAKG